MKIEFNDFTPGKFPYFIEILNFCLKAFNAGTQDIAKKISRRRLNEYLSIRQKNKTLEDAIDLLVSQFSELTKIEPELIRTDIIHLKEQYHTILGTISVFQATNNQIIWSMLYHFLIPIIAGMLNQYRIRTNSPIFETLEQNHFFLENAKLQGKSYQLPFEKVLRWLIKIDNKKTFYEFASDDHGQDEDLLTNFKRWRKGETIPSFEKIKQLVRNKMNEKYQEVIPVLLTARILHYCIKKALDYWGKVSTSILIEVFHTQYLLQRNSPPNYQFIISDAIFILFELDFFNATPNKIQSGKNKIHISKEYLSFIENLYENTLPLVPIGLLKTQISLLHCEKESFRAKLDLANYLNHFKREKQANDEIEIENLIKDLLEIKPYKLIWGDEIDYIQAQFLIQQAKYNEAQIYYKNALQKAENRNGELIKKIITEGSLLAAFLSRDGEHNIESFKLFYEAGLWLKLFSKPLENEKESILLEFRKRFVWQFDEKSFFRSTPEKEIEKFKRQKTLTFNFIDMTLKPDIKNPNKIIRNQIASPMPQVIFFALQGKVDTVKQLIEAGADLNQLAGDNSTILIQSIPNIKINTPEHKQILTISNFLLDNYDLSSIINIQTKQKRRSALSNAIDGQHYEIVKKLIKQGVDVNQKNTTDDVTPLYQVINNFGMFLRQDIRSWDSDEVQEKLNMQYIAPPDALRKHLLPFQQEIFDNEVLQSFEITKELNSSMHKQMYEQFYSKEDYFKIFELLLTAKADTEILHFQNFTVLIYAGEVGEIFFIKKLVDAGAKINAVNKQNVTSLIMACSRNHTEAALYLIEKGADINIQGYQSKTALMMAVLQGNKKIVSALLSAGAKKDLKNDSEKTAYDIAIENQQYEILNLLV